MRRRRPFAGGARTGGPSRRDLFSGGSARARGTTAEEAGAHWLEAQGYRILERNVASRFGEIDLVALDAGTLCFVEIKARRSLTCGHPAEAVTPDKQRRLTRCALAYLARYPQDRPCRFDVLGMRAVGREWRFELIRDAFSAVT